LYILLSISFWEEEEEKVTASSILRCLIKLTDEIRGGGMRMNVQLKSSFLLSPYSHYYNICRYTHRHRHTHSEFHPFQITLENNGFPLQL